MMRPDTAWMLFVFSTSYVILYVVAHHILRIF